MKLLSHVFLLGLFMASTTLVRGESVEWVRQIGASNLDQSDGVSADGLGNVYISGYTDGSLSGNSSAGTFDAFVSKYNSTGSLLWTRQLGTPSFDVSYGVSADKLGSVYITGYTIGNLGGPNSGNADAYVSKFSAAGGLLWTRQLGTATNDNGVGVSADGLGNVYISGFTAGNLGGTNAGDNDAFVSKYDAAGTLAWTKQLGTPTNDQSFGVSADGLGSVYICGETTGSLGGLAGGSSDAFISKYDSAGARLWTRQIGTAGDDSGRSVAADGLGNVYMSGYTTGSLGGPNAGNSYDAFVSKYDAAGNLLWIRQLGTTSEDRSLGVSADRLGNVYISGYTLGNLSGPVAGTSDAFVSKYDAAGNFLWTQQLGSADVDLGQSVSADGLGSVYLSGYTYGSFGGPTAGGYDAFVAKIADPVVPEPSTVTLVAMCILATYSCRKRWQ